MTDQVLFTELARQSRPLSAHLYGRPEVRELLGSIQAAQSSGALDALGEQVDEQIRAMAPEPPTLGPPTRGRVDEGCGAWRRQGDGVSAPTTRYYVRYDVRGDVELLRHWPDDSQQPLKSVQDELMERIGGYDNLQQSSDSDSREYFELSATWGLYWITKNGPWALYTSFDLTREEERTLGAGGIHRMAAERFERVGAIVEEIGAQSKRFFEIELPQLVSEQIEERRGRLADREALLIDLAVPDEWHGEPMHLEAVRRTKAEHSEEVATPASGLGVPMEYRLTRKSFTDVLRTIRTWADAVEQNPTGFGHLNEDAVSDLLAATLNATVPQAGREVFSRSGKVDIHVRPDVLAEGSGPAQVFVCETKWADGRARIVEGLEEQIFRYLTAHSTSAVLLALCKQSKFETAQANVRNWAAAAKGFVEQTDGPVAGWPNHVYDVEGRTVEVCIATVSIPPATTRAGKAK